MDMRGHNKKKRMWWINHTEITFVQDCILFRFTFHFEKSYINLMEKWSLDTGYHMWKYSIMSIELCYRLSYSLIIQSVQSINERGLGP